ncbi:unnamed protein product, partial [Vitis vinifera]|uniref:Uncharacterized protein n=1 Tax=Vitis vinifera TaxID=29760 RepID=D7T591_VITVI|eukprot:XP_019073732.1 PREDICTED: uncharacterized protein LOC104878215 [Vitis vinifera]
MASVLSKKQKKREKYTLSDLKTLGNQLLSSRAHVNNLPLLLTFVSPSSPPQHVLETILSLQSFFTIDLPSKPSIHSKTDPELIYRTWLRSKFDDFVKSLIDILTSSTCEETLREVVLDTIMELVKLGNSGRFNSAVYHRFIHSIVGSTMSVTFLLDLLESKYFKYIDVRYFTYISLEKITKTLEAKDISDNRTASADEDSKSHSKARLVSLFNFHFHFPTQCGLISLFSFSSPQA